MIGGLDDHRRRSGRGLRDRPEDDSRTERCATAQYQHDTQQCTVRRFLEPRVEPDAEAAEEIAEDHEIERDPPSRHRSARATQAEDGPRRVRSLARSEFSGCEPDDKPYLVHPPS